MAQKRRSKPKKRTQRDTKSYHKRESVLRTRKKSRQKEPLPYDRREFRPLYDDIPYYTTGEPVNFHVEGPKVRNLPPKPVRHPLGWPSKRFKVLDPLRLPVCIRRKARRSILFKLGKAGKGKAGPKNKITSPTSYIKCT